MILDITKQLDFINDSLKKTFYPKVEEEKISDEHSDACNGCALCECDDEKTGDEYEQYKSDEIDQLNANRN